MSYKHDNPCADAAADDEPIFTLRAQDKLAPIVLQVWISLAELFQVPADKRDEARACLHEMRFWQDLNADKTKYPD